MDNLEEDFNDFSIEEVERYKLTVEHNGKSLITTGNNVEGLKNIYDELIRDNLTSDDHLVVAIYDYNLDTNIYYYDSDEERV